MKKFDCYQIKPVSTLIREIAWSLLTEFKTEINCGIVHSPILDFLCCSLDTYDIINILKRRK